MKICERSFLFTTPVFLINMKMKQRQMEHIFFLFICVVKVILSNLVRRFLIVQIGYLRRFEWRWTFFSPSWLMSVMQLESLKDFSGSLWKKAFSNFSYISFIVGAVFTGTHGTRARWPRETRSKLFRFSTLVILRHRATIDATRPVEASTTLGRLLNMFNLLVQEEDNHHASRFSRTTTRWHIHSSPSFFF